MIHLASTFAAVNVLGNTSQTRRRVPGILVALALLCHTVAAQDAVRLQGLIDQCYGVSIADSVRPHDALILDRRLPDSVTTAYLVCMQTLTPPDTASTDSLVSPTCVGTSTQITIRSRVDSLIAVDLHGSSGIDPSCVYQLVVPVVADTIIVDSLLTTRPWNGTSGGIIMLEAQHELVIHDTISVRGLGYRGGLRSTNGGECNANERCAPRSSDRMGAKGESFHGVDEQCASGYSAWATGGGGGGAHNCGGGGGGNAGNGGRGGDQFTGCGAPGYVGLPGMRVSAEPSLAWLFGGGGGGGHQNNNAGTDGAAGGGVIVLRAPMLRGDRAVCVASGESVTRRAGNDGGGGGGAGGTLVVDICAPMVPITLVAAGGNGGNCDDAHGPGGGGGGGRLLLHPSMLQQRLVSTAINVAGGNAGLSHSGRSSANAMAGNAGSVNVLCNSVPLHETRLGSAVSIGDTTVIHVVALHQQQNCDVYVQHNILLKGGAVVPVVDSALADILYEDRQLRWNERLLTIQLRSTQSATVTLRGVLSRDTVASVEVRSMLSGTDNACEQRSAPQVVTVSACGSKLRPIVLGRPFRLRHTGSDATSIGIQVEGPRSADVHLRLFNLQGQLATELVLQRLSYIEPGVYSFEDRIAMQHLAHGLYYLTAISSLGIAGIPILWMP